MLLNEFIQIMIENGILQIDSEKESFIIGCSDVVEIDYKEASEPKKTKTKKSKANII